MSKEILVDSHSSSEEEKIVRKNFFDISKNYPILDNENISIIGTIFKQTTNEKRKLLHKINRFLQALIKIKNWRDYIKLVQEKILNDKLVIVLRNGLKCCIPSNQIARGVINEVFFNEVYNFDKLKIINPENIFDIGGYIGLSMLYFYNKYPDSKIWVFEPVPDNFKFIEKNIELNKCSSRINLSKLAISSRKGYFKMAIDKKRIKLGGSSLIFDQDITKYQSKSDIIEVNSTTLEKILENVTTLNNLIKMDIEGAEYDVLYNLNPSFFEKIPIIMLEYHFRDDKKRNGDFLRDFLVEKGYKVIQKPEPDNERLGYLLCKRNM